MSKVGIGRKVKKNLLYIIAAAILIFIAAIIGIYAIGKIYNPVTTELALNYEVEDTITVEGIVFRDENVVTYDGDGALDYLVGDGERVSQGGIIARSYRDADDVIAEREIRELTKQAENLKNIASASDVYVIGVDTVVKQITEGLCDVADCDGNSGIGDMAAAVGTLNDNIMKKQVATGGMIDFTDKINEINSRIEKLKGSVETSPDTVTANEAGYFYNNCDGYEGVVDINSITDMTIAEFDAIKPNDVKGNEVGKIADSYTWYYVFKADSETARNFKQEATIYARFALVSSEKFEIKVEAMNFEGDTALIVLKSEHAITDMTSDRDQPLEVILDTHTGLRVDDRAVRIVDGVTGVYVQMGYEVKFRTIDIAYQTEEFAIVPASSEEGKLKLYDSVIVKGEELYDGKLLS